MCDGCLHPALSNIPAPDNCVLVALSCLQPLTARAAITPCPVPGCGAVSKESLKFLFSDFGSLPSFEAGSALATEVSMLPQLAAVPLAGRVRTHARAPLPFRPTPRRVAVAETIPVEAGTLAHIAPALPPAWQSSPATYVVAECRHTRRACAAWRPCMPVLRSLQRSTATTKGECDPKTC
jgi:hypothetical protein